jgi:hypothetical protein
LHGFLSQEAASLGAVGSISMKETRILIDARKLKIYTAEVLLLIGTCHISETVSECNSRTHRCVLFLISVF